MKAKYNYGWPDQKVGLQESLLEENIHYALNYVFDYKSYQTFFMTKMNQIYDRHSFYFRSSITYVLMNSDATDKKCIFSFVNIKFILFFRKLVL